MKRYLCTEFETMQKSDIKDLNDIKNLVDTFYGKVREDELIGPVFNERIGNRWPEHLAKMYTFWQTVLLNDGKTYFGQPFAPHATLPVVQDHFDRWLQIFKNTLDELFEGEIKEEAWWRAQKMAEIFMYKIDFLRNHSSEKSIQ